MFHSNKPIIWGLFAAGGTVAAFVVPVLILMTCLAVPLGLLSSDALSYEHLLDLMQQPFSKLVTFAMLFLVIWHAAHRIRITAHDLGIRNDTLVILICYGIAAAGTLLVLAALFSI
ncbi:MAG: fumarate reductase subunit D [Proteobacteria bacterium]|nr:fumarate reductase subunit D [Pseudomonadota bacterium]